MRYVWSACILVCAAMSTCGGHGQPTDSTAMAPSEPAITAQRDVDCGMHWRFIALCCSQGSMVIVEDTQSVRRVRDSDGTVLWRTDPILPKPRSIVCCPEVGVLAIGCEDGTVCLLDIETGKETMRRKIHKDAVIDIVWSRAMRCIVAAAGEDGVTICSLPGLETILQIREPAVSVAAASDAPYIAIAWTPLRKYKIDVLGKSRTLVLEAAPNVSGEFVALSPDGDKLASSPYSRSQGLLGLTPAPEIVALFTGNNAKPIMVGFGPIPRGTTESMVDLAFVDNQRVVAVTTKRVVLIDSARGRVMASTAVDNPRMSAACDGTVVLQIALSSVLTVATIRDVSAPKALPAPAGGVTRPSDTK